MLKPLTLKFLALFVVGYGLLLLPGMFWPGMFWPEYFDSPTGLLLLVPYLSIHLFHKLGIPGLLEHMACAAGAGVHRLFRCHFHNCVLGDGCVGASLGFGSMVIALSSQARLGAALERKIALDSPSEEIP